MDKKDVEVLEKMIKAGIKTDKKIEKIKNWSWRELSCLHRAVKSPRVFRLLFELRISTIATMEKSSTSSSTRYSPYQNASSTRQQAREHGTGTTKTEVVSGVQKEIDQSIVHPPSEQG